MGLQTVPVPRILLVSVTGYNNCYFPHQVHAEYMAETEREIYYVHPFYCVAPNNNFCFFLPYLLIYLFIYLFQSDYNFPLVWSFTIPCINFQ